MRKIPLLGAASIIGLSGLVVIGSSPELVDQIFSSVRSNPVTRAFFTETEHGSENQVPAEREVSKPDDSKKSAYTRPDGKSATEVPETVLWSVIFSLPQRLDAAAESAKSVGEDDSLWSNYFVRQAKILPASSQLLYEESARFSVEVQSIDEQAELIIRQIRETSPQPSLNPNGGIIPDVSDVPNELKNLQIQKDELTLRLRDNFRAAIGEEEFAKFSDFLANEFAKGFVRHEIEPGKRTPKSVPGNNGFEPFGGSNKGGGRQ